MFLESIYKMICNNSKDKLIAFVTSNADNYVTCEEFERFTDWFKKEEKISIKDSVNIHGMGGSRLPKPSITSIASLYVSSISYKTIVKTGSSKNTSLLGSTDYFRALGLLTPVNRRQYFEKYGFAYYDYLELSPWKRYKEILCLNRSINEILHDYHFFEYKIGVLGLGISSKELYAHFLKKVHYPKPVRHFIFYSKVEGRILDEILPPDNNQIILPTLSIDDILRINYNLTFGLEDDTLWLGSLRESVAFFLYQLGETDSVAEGRELFNRAYRDRVVKRNIDMLGVLP